jgi:hypothetical protein
MHLRWGVVFILFLLLTVLRHTSEVYMLLLDLKRLTADACLILPSVSRVFNIAGTPQNLSAWPVLPTYQTGHTITCYADANPPATYVWQNLKTLEYTVGDSFVIYADMLGYQLMRCTAQNTMMGLNYTREFYLDVYVNGEQPLAQLFHTQAIVRRYNYH